MLSLSVQESTITEINIDAYWYFQGEKEKKKRYAVTVLAIVDGCTKKSYKEIATSLQNRGWT